MKKICIITFYLEYIYNLKDHLGNVRLSFKDDGTNVNFVYGASNQRVLKSCLDTQENHFVPERNYGLSIDGIERW